jgi:hypothetical protein
VPRFLFIPPGWEVVQLVGLQTLNLAILVRVQASQPNMFNHLAGPVLRRSRQLGTTGKKLVSRRHHFLLQPPDRTALRLVHRLDVVRQRRLC